MTISKKLLFITILNIPVVFSTFTQSNLETIENYVSTLHNQHQPTKQNKKIAKWLNKKLDNFCQYYEDKEAMARQKTFNDSLYNYPTVLEPICIRDCSNTELTHYNKEEVAALSQIIQNYPNTREAILKALISDEEAEQIALDAKVELYNAQQQKSEDYINDILDTDRRPRWLKNNLIQYITSPLSDNESTARFIDH